VVVAAEPNLPPTAAFSSTCTFLACSFTDASTDSDGQVVSWAWTFGDGGGSTLQNPPHSFSVAGTYTVGLTVTDDDGATHSTSQQVSVVGQPNNPPTAAFTASCTFLACSFTDASTDSDGQIVSRSWTFGDGGTSTATNPSRTYATAGNYLVWLTVTDNGGATHSTSQQVSVTAPPNLPPIAAFTSSCSFLACSFTDTSTDSDGQVVGWSWSFGDGATSTLRHPARTYATAGTYTVSLTVTDNGGATHSTSQQVVVTAPNVPPTAAFTSSCTFLACTFTDASTDSDGQIVSRSWTFGDGATSTATNPSRTYGAAGTYLVWLTVTDNGGATHSTSQQVSVTGPGGGTTMHIADLDGVAQPAGRSWNAVVTNRVVDNTGAPVAGATVTGEWRGAGFATCVTNSAGTCTVTLSTGKVAMSWTVVNITHPSRTYNPSANTDPEGDSDGTVIWLDRP